MPLFDYDAACLCRRAVLPSILRALGNSAAVESFDASQTLAETSGAADERLALYRERVKTGFQTLVTLRERAGASQR